jgi:diguanylate cyclase (GGDEF)-like protein/PAS domain S-box-containing protein
MNNLENIEKEILYYATDFLSLVDKEYYYVYVNEAYARTWGRPVDEFIGNKVEKLLGVEVFNQALKPNIDRCLAGEKVDFDVPIDTSHGQGYFHVSYTPRRDSNGDVTGVFINGRDISDLNVAQQRLNRTLSELSLAIATAKLGFWRFDLATEKLNWNDELYKIHGLSREEFDGEVETWKASLHPEDRAFVDEKFAEVATPEGVEGIGFRIIRPSGEVRHLQASGRAICSDSGDIQELIGINYDVTEIYQSESRYRTLVESAPICIYQINPGGELISMNQIGLQMMGVSDENALVGMPYLSLVCAEDRVRVHRLMQDAFRGQAAEYDFTGSKGEEFSSSFVPITAADGRVDRLLGLTQDVTARNQTERELKFRASHDVLTGLINRREFEHRLERLLSSAFDDSVTHALCFMDLDQFKVVNDTCGHAAGDALLKQLGHDLSKTVRQRDTLARLGGDEFGVLMEHCTLSQARRAVKQLQNAVDEFRFSWQDHEFTIGVSIGLVAIDESSLDVSEIMKRADAACYMAKDRGRNQVCEYRQHDDKLTQLRGEMNWATVINGALKEDRFELYAQRIERIGKGRKMHFELLLRMISSEGDIIAPGAFLPSAERYSLMRKIDEWVVRHAFELLALHPDFLSKVEFVAVNLSGHSLSNPALLDQIMDWLEEFDTDLEKICFEVTETAAIANLGAAMRFFSTLKGLGCRFALDDFGTGLSSFSYLKNLPVDFLKIDGQFVRNMAIDPIDHAMVKSINEIGHLMGLQTIAEFVESDQILAELRVIGVDYAQGYAIGKPQPFRNLLEGAV